MTMREFYLVIALCLALTLILSLDQQLAKLEFEQWKKGLAPSSPHLEPSSD